MGPEGNYHIDIPSDDTRCESDNWCRSSEEAESKARDYLDYELKRNGRDCEESEVWIVGPNGERTCFNPQTRQEK